MKQYSHESKSIQTLPQVSVLFVCLFVFVNCRTKSLIVQIRATCDCMVYSKVNKKYKEHVAPLFCPDKNTKLNIPLNMQYKIAETVKDNTAFQ